MNTPQLPPLPKLDAAAFRRELAGLTDPQAPKAMSADYKELASEFCRLLAKRFNRDQLDALTLWDRIATAVTTACGKVDDGDLDRLICLALETIKADVSLAASDQELAYWIGTVTERDESWRLGFVRYLKQHTLTVIVHGRRLWEITKDTRREEREAVVNGSN